MDIVVLITLLFMSGDVVTYIYPESYSNMIVCTSTQKINMILIKDTNRNNSIEDRVVRATFECIKRKGFSI